MLNTGINPPLPCLLVSTLYFSCASTIPDYTWLSTLYYRYFEDFEKKIPRHEIEQIEKIIKKEIHELDPEYLVTICGSYRYVILIASFTIVDNFCGSDWYVILMFHHCLVMICGSYACHTFCQFYYYLVTICCRDGPVILIVSFATVSTW